MLKKTSYLSGRPEAMEKSLAKQIYHFEQNCAQIFFPCYMSTVLGILVLSIQFMPSFSLLFSLLIVFLEV